MPARLKRLAESRWHAIPGSEMNSVFVPGTDDQSWMRPGSWAAIQAGWSGAVCTGAELVLWGGGHSNGNHNGLLAVSPQGQWRRLTEPSPIWTEAQCPEGICPAATGPCAIRKCNTGPDGRPVSRHTYYLLGYRDGAIYSVTGSTAPSGAVGDPPHVWRYIIGEDRWEPLPDTPSPLAHGSIFIVGDMLYHAAGWKGLSVLNLGTLEWEKRSGGYGGQTGVIHVPTLDRVYVLGNGKFEWVERTAFGLVSPTEVPRRPGDEILDVRHLGLAYHAAEDVILAWNGGRDLHVIDPHTHAVSRLRLPGDDPGPPLKNGTFGRLSYCGGRVMLVNGVNRPVHVLLQGGESPSAAPVPVSPHPRALAASQRSEPPQERPARQGERASPAERAREYDRLVERKRVSKRERPSDAERTARRERRAGEERPPGQAREPKHQRLFEGRSSSEPNPLTDPYYPEPPGGSLDAFDSWVDSICGPRNQWSVLDVGPGHAVTDAADVRVESGERVVIRVHPTESEHGPLMVKKARCVEVVGVPDAQGNRPVLNGINMTRGFGGAGESIVDGGLIIRNVHIRHARNDCIGSPNDGRFLSVEDSLVEMCGHHGVITARSPHFYFRSLRTTWRYAQSHLLYIHRIARSDIVDSVCEAPGWGHCLRSLARVSVITGNQVSNVALDGTVPPAGSNPVKPKRNFLGMHPVDVYACAEGRVANNTITYYRKSGANISVPINVRYRPGIAGCDLAEHRDKAWGVLDPKSAEFQDPATWRRIRAAGQAGRLTLTISDNSITVLGPDRADHQSVGVQGGSLPLMDGVDRDGLAQWLATWWSNADRTRPLDELWRQMRSALPQPHWKLIADLVLPQERQRFMKGAFPSNMPLPVPIGDWFQRQTVRIGPHAVRVCDEPGQGCRASSNPLLRPYAIDFIYYGEADAAKQLEGPTYRRAFVEILP